MELKDYQVSPPQL